MGGLQAICPAGFELDTWSGVSVNLWMSGHWGAVKHTRFIKETVMVHSLSVQILFDQMFICLKLIHAFSCCLKILTLVSYRKTVIELSELFVLLKKPMSNLMQSYFRIISYFNCVCFTQFDEWQYNNTLQQRRKKVLPVFFSQAFYRQR